MPRGKRTASATGKRNQRGPSEASARAYTHTGSDIALRPEVGTQPQFRKKKPPATYRYDSSLSPSLEWDEQNAAREKGEWLLLMIEKAAALSAPHRFETPQEFTSNDGHVTLSVHTLQEAVVQLKRLGQSFLNWAGKAERHSFDVPTLPLFVHERLSTKAIIETLTSHEKKADQSNFFDLFGDPRRSVSDQVLKAYEYRDKWVNRMILGDSLVVMNSLLHYEGMGGQVQMIYIDPPYGVKFGSNFQPFVRKREVSHNDDGDLTREPEMVKAYRDTWELGLHSYLTYLRDRLLLARDLLHPSGSVFVQISDENVHHVREITESVFGGDNFIVSFLVKKTGSQKGTFIEAVNDYVLWFARDSSRLPASFSKLYEYIPLEQQIEEGFNHVELQNGEDLSLSELAKRKGKSANYYIDPQILLNEFPGAKLFAPNPLTSGGYRKNQSIVYNFRGRSFDPGLSRGNCWKHTAVSQNGGSSGMDRLAADNRLFAGKGQLRFKRYTSDFCYKEITNWWDGLGGASNPIYVVQTNAEIVRRCMLMSTRPGDLVLDPTCGSGTTAYVAEQWGRRWITIDTSRVPLALARQRLLTATFPYYQLKEEHQGPASGFVYARKLNRKGEEVGGIVPHITSSTIANNEPPEETVIVDRPETERKVTRVSGPFCVEATIATPVDWEGDGIEDSGTNADVHGSFLDRMLEVLRKSPVLQVGGGKTVTLKSVRPPAKSLSLSAEAVVEGGESASLSDLVAIAHEKNTGGSPFSQNAVALVFGPENGAVSEKLVWEAAREASAKNYTHLYVIGFAIQPNARSLVQACESAMGIAATFVTATPDLMMGDLLKNMRSSQIFSVCGMPETRLRTLPPEKKGGSARFQAELLGLDVFDPATMETVHRSGDDVPCWLLDTDYNGLVFHGAQVFFPRTAAWDGLKKALKATHEESVWDHLAGTASAPFEAGEHGQVAIKVIDDRGNELLVVTSLKDAV